MLIGRKLWRFEQYRNIHIDHLQRAIVQHRNDMLNKSAAWCLMQLGIGIGKMLPNIPKPCCTKKCIAERMQNNITIAMGNDSIIGWNSNTSQHQMLALAKPMNVDTETNTHANSRIISHY
jgi:hypothetical protein